MRKFVEIGGDSVALVMALSPDGLEADQLLDGYEKSSGRNVADPSGAAPPAGGTCAR